MTFQITVLPSERQFNALADETLLAAGLRQNMGLPYGCKDGACGSCKCKLISGTVKHGIHQDKALSTQEKADGLVLTCCATAQTDVVLECKQVTSADAFPIKKMPVRVSKLDKLSDDVMLIQLQLPATDHFGFRAGQYIDFILRDGDRRSYSMANAPSDAKTVDLHVRHMPGGKFTDHVFVAMKEKEILRIEGPHGGFYLREDSTKPIVFLASGTGFAPIKAVLEHMHAQGIQRPCTLYWGGRRPQDLYMNDWVLAQMSKMPTLSYVPVISDAQPEDQWTGRTGFVHEAVLADQPDLSGHQVYACGAPVVVESARQTYVANAKLPENEFYADAFTSKADKLVLAGA